jgi:hypothetical protein
VDDPPTTQKDKKRYGTLITPLIFLQSVTPAGQRKLIDHVAHFVSRFGYGFEEWIKRDFRNGKLRITVRKAVRF